MRAASSKVSKMSVCLVCLGDGSFSNLAFTIHEEGNGEADMVDGAFAALEGNGVTGEGTRCTILHTTGTIVFDEE